MIGMGKERRLGTNGINYLCRLESCEAYGRGEDTDHFCMHHFRMFCKSIKAMQQLAEEQHQLMLALGDTHNISLCDHLLLSNSCLEDEDADKHLEDGLYAFHFTARSNLDDLVLNDNGEIALKPNNMLERADLEQAPHWNNLQKRDQKFDNEKIWLTTDFTRGIQWVMSPSHHNVQIEKGDVWHCFVETSPNRNILT